MRNGWCDVEERFESNLRVQDHVEGQNVCYWRQIG